MTIVMNIISVHSSLLMYDSIQDVIRSKVVSTLRFPHFIQSVPRSDSSTESSKVEMKILHRMNSEMSVRFLKSLS